MLFVSSCVHYLKMIAVTWLVRGAVVGAEFIEYRIQRECIC